MAAMLRNASEHLPSNSSESSKLHVIEQQLSCFTYCTSLTVRGFAFYFSSFFPADLIHFYFSKDLF